MDATKFAGNGFTPSENTQTAGPVDATRSGTGNANPHPSSESLLSKSAPNTSGQLAQMYDPIAADLVEVERYLVAQLQSPYEAIGELLRHGTQLGGKRMRPALVMLAGKAIGSTTPDHVTVATVVEMVHTATLIHDDVLDEAETRRHVATVNAKWNQDTSILLGDYLFSQSFTLAAQLSSTEVCRWVGEAARRVCEGELRQVLQRDVLDIDETTYLEILRGKTAELCRVSCQLGARQAGGTDSQIAALGGYGNALGIAFQIADDFLDLWGDDTAIGKTLGTDIEQGKVTLPLIRLLDQITGHQRQEVIEILSGPSNQRVSRIRPLLAASDAKEYTQRVAHQHRDRAVASLDALVDSPAKESLIAIADFAVNRKF